MQAPPAEDARREWLAVERRIAAALATDAGPTPAQVFLRGFMSSSLLQLTVCSPPRRVAMSRSSGFHVVALGKTDVAPAARAGVGVLAAR